MREPKNRIKAPSGGHNIGTIILGSRGIVLVCYSFLHGA